ncbi:MAG TPA: ABC transporter ATP-binding protein [Erysipelothrix sp.]|nr:ABC transporter ATP-binding protein [Erysipelothrix sp.]
MSYINVDSIKKYYQVGDNQIKAVDDISFEIPKGQFVVVVGPSGAGKTTVMNILGGMDLPTDGAVLIDGKEITHYSDKKLTQYRRDDVGFVFQSYNLISNLTALENVELGAQIKKDTKDPMSVLSQVGLNDRANNFPSQLSGGEQQRVAIARAIAKNPKILLCDEPTGALDTSTGQQVLKVLRECCDVYKMTVILITHNQFITQMADRVIEIKNGQVAHDTLNETILSVDDIQW